MRCAAENAANGRKSYDIGAHPITGAGILRDTAAPSSLNPTETTPQRLRGATLIGISPWRANHEQGRSIAKKFSSQYSRGLHGCGSGFIAGRTRCGSRGNTRTPLAGDGGIVSSHRTRQGRQPSAPQAGDRLRISQRLPGKAASLCSQPGDQGLREQRRVSSGSRRRSHHLRRPQPGGFSGRPAVALDPIYRRGRGGNPFPGTGGEPRGAHQHAAHVFAHHLGNGHRSADYPHPPP